MRFYDFQAYSKSWYCHKPLPVTESPTEKISWDFSLVTNYHHSSNCPDILLYDFCQQQIFFVEISCSADINVLSKEDEKINKYSSLEVDFIRYITCQLLSYQLYWDVQVWSPHNDCNI